MRYRSLSKSLRWAIVIVPVVACLVAGFYYHPVITGCCLVIAWLGLMLYMDPPGKWNL